jgi:hypothetical protein
MRDRVEIENIEEMRRREGIEDVELRQDICGLRVGDAVNLTLLSGVTSSAAETVRVRITSIRDYGFRGKLTSKPASAGLSTLDVGSAIVFTAAHIHSLSKRRPAHER